jgi:Flp pilus assembly protein CpaB
VNRITVLIVAALVALGSGFALVNYVGNANKRATAGADLVVTLVATQDVPDGTPFAAAWNNGLVVQSKTLRSALPASAVSDPAALKDMVAAGVLRKGQLVVNGTFADSASAKRLGPATFADELPKDTVAVSFQAAAPQAVADLIRPGDRINLLIGVPNAAELGLPDSGGPAILHAFRNLQIIAIGAVTAPHAGATEAAANPGTGLYSVAVPPQDAARLLFLTSQYDVYLTLVGPSTGPGDPVPLVDKANAFPPA